MSKHFTQLLTVAAALAITGIAGATTRSEVPSTIVKFGDLALNTKAGVATLHARIHAAAQFVCSGIDSRILGLRDQYDTCVSDAVRDGVAAVGNPNLSNFHIYGKKMQLMASNQD